MIREAVRIVQDRSGKPIALVVIDTFAAAAPGAHDALHWFFEVSPELARELAANLVKAAELAEQLRARPLPELPIHAQ